MRGPRTPSTRRPRRLDPGAWGRTWRSELFERARTRAGYATAAAEEQRQASRDLASTLADNNAKRISALTSLQQYGVDASKVPAEVYSSLYGTGTSAANAAMGNATNAAKTPGFWDQFLPALAQGAGSAARGFGGVPGAAGAPGSVPISQLGGFSNLNLTPGH